MAEVRGFKESLRGKSTLSESFFRLVTLEALTRENARGAGSPAYKQYQPPALPSPPGSVIDHGFRYSSIASRVMVLPPMSFVPATVS